MIVDDPPLLGSTSRERVDDGAEEGARLVARSSGSRAEASSRSGIPASGVPQREMNSVAAARR
jgi:hypothetical protein